MRRLLPLLCASLLWGACPDFSPVRFGVKHREDKGIGYDQGYTTLTAFLTPNWVRSFQPFIDTRAHVFNNGRWAYNLGLGSRWQLLQDYTWAFGINSFYDFRDESRLRAHQWGGGLELLSDNVDFRCNGYVPFGVTRTFSQRFAGFEGFGANFIQKRRTAIAHVDAEIGAPIRGPFTFMQPYFAIGPYYLFKSVNEFVSCGNAWGGQARLSLLLMSGFEIGGQFSYDREFHGITQGYAALRLPLGPSNTKRARTFYQSHRLTGVTVPKRENTRWYRRYGTCESAAIKTAVLTQPVQRAEIIPICKDRFEFNSATGGAPGAEDRECIIFFVDNTVAAGGNGSTGMPFNTLKAAEAASLPGDVIFVRTGAGIAGMDEGIILKEGQELLGEGSCQDTTTDCGIIPAEGGTPPTITNTGGSAVIAAANTTINGLIIENAALHGIEANPASNITIVCNTIQGNAGEGIFLNAISGSMALISINDINSNGLNGINVQGSNNATYDTFVISNSAIDSNTLSGIASTASNSAAMTMTIQNNTTINSNTLHGINVTTQDTTTYQLSVLTNPVDSNLTDGILVNASGSTFTNLIQDSTANSNLGRGISLTTGGPLTFTSQILGTTASSNGSHGIEIVGDGSSTLTSTIMDNSPSVTNLNGGSGITLTAQGSSSLTSTITNHVANTNASGISLAGAGTGTFTNTCTSCTTNSNTNNGVLVSLVDSASCTNTLSTHTSNSNTDGFNASCTSNSATASNLNITDNSFFRSNTRGMDFTLAGTADFQILVNNSTDTQSNGTGTRINASSGSSTCTITGTQSTSDGTTLNINATAGTHTCTISSGILSPNSTPIVQTCSNAGTSSTLNVLSNTIIYRTLEAILSTTDSGSTGELNATFNTITTNISGVSGIQTIADGGSTQRITISNNTIRNNGAGFQGEPAIENAVRGNGSTIATGSVINNNTLDGFGSGFMFRSLNAPTNCSFNYESISNNTVRDMRFQCFTAGDTGGSANMNTVVVNNFNSNDCSNSLEGFNIGSGLGNNVSLCFGSFNNNRITGMTSGNPAYLFLNNSITQGCMNSVANNIASGNANNGMFMFGNIDIVNNIFTDNPLLSFVFLGLGAASPAPCTFTCP